MNKPCSLVITTFTCILASISFYSVAQNKDNNEFLPGYIITTSNDTLQGLILTKYHFYNAKNCVFKTSSNSPEQSFTPDQIKGYHIDGKLFYRSHSIVHQFFQEKLFLECIVRGKVSLFFYQDQYFVENAGQIEELITSKEIFNEGGKTYTRESPLYKSVLQKEMSDCMTIHQNLMETTLSKKSLTRLFIDYNSCIGQEAVLYESITGKFNIRFGFSAGLFASNFDVKSNDGSAFYYLRDANDLKDISYTVCFRVEFSRREMSRFQLRTGLTYYKGSYHTFEENLSINLSHELNVEYTRVEIPLLVKYNLSRGGHGLYFVGGFGSNMFLSWEDTEVVRVPPSFVYRESSPLQNNLTFLNLLGGLGCDFPIGKHALNVEVMYGRGIQVLRPGQSDMSGAFNALTFTAGFSF